VRLLRLIDRANCRRQVGSLLLASAIRDDALHVYPQEVQEALDALLATLDGAVPELSADARRCVLACIRRGLDRTTVARRAVPVGLGLQNSTTGDELGFYAACSYSLMRPPRTASQALDPYPGKIGDRVVWAGRAQLATAMGSACVLIGLVLGEDRPQMSFAEDEHPVGDPRFVR
jgi:hypothetical protein